MSVRKSPIIGSALIIAVLIIASIGVGFAYIAYTENSGNGIDVGQKSIMIYDSAGTSLECMELPAVTYSGSNNSWDVGYYDSHISGKLIASTPESDDCKIRVWVEMEDIRSWILIEKLTVRLEGVDYVLFNDKGADTKATEQTNAQIIKISNSDKGRMLDLAVMVTYKEHLDFNPNNISNLGKSKVMFALHTSDPIHSGYTVTFKLKKIGSANYDNYWKLTENPNPEHSYETEGYVFPGDLIKPAATPTCTKPNPENYQFKGWYKDEACTVQWNFSSDRLDEKAFYAGWSHTNINLYGKWQYAVYYNLNDGSGNKTTVWVDYNVKLVKPDDPVRDGFTFGGWYTDQEYTKAWNFGSDTVKDSVSLYAKWTAI